MEKGDQECSIVVKNASKYEEGTWSCGIFEELSFFQRIWNAKGAHTNATINVTVSPSNAAEQLPTNVANFVFLGQKDEFYNPYQKQ